MFGDDGVEGLNVGVRHFGGGEEVADHVGTGLLLSRGRHIPW
jgi:hypothetical protein